MSRLIDADALMKEFAEFVKDSNNSDFVDVPTWNDAVSLLGSAPTIEPQRWIPVSERLPESGHDVIFCDSNGIVCRGIYSAITREWIGSQWNTIRLYGGVVAWMPLPEPYQSET